MLEQVYLLSANRICQSRLFYWTEQARAGLLIIDQTEDVRVGLFIINAEDARVGLLIINLTEDVRVGLFIKKNMLGQVYILLTKQYVRIGLFIIDRRC